MFDDFENDIERAESLQNMLIARSRGILGNEPEYKLLRHYFLNNSDTKSLLPKFVRTSRDLDQFWPFIKNKYTTYAERSAFIYSEFTKLFDYLEGKTSAPADSPITEGLKNFDAESVQAVWKKALERRSSDPEAAITSARTLLETVCKHILDTQGIEYDSSMIKLNELYKLTSESLNLSPSQHTEDIFKQILGGCSSIVNGLGTLRNRLGDAHGKGKVSARPAPRHAELAVNLSGSVALFLVSTWETLERK